MINQLQVQNFRLFDNFKIDQLARVNLIVGKNNVGKSSLLEGIYLLTNQENPSVLLELLESRGEIIFPDDPLITNRSLRSTRFYDMSHLFFGHQLKYNLSLYLAGTGDKNLALKITVFTDIHQLSLFGGDEQADLTRLRLDYGDSSIIFEINVSGRLKRDSNTIAYMERIRPTPPSIYLTTKSLDYRQLAQLWDGITLTSKENDVTKMLRILDPQVERIGFKSRPTATSGILIKQLGQDTPLPLGIMGDGMYRILATAMALANAENGYLLIDDIDTGLHYSAITDMWRIVFETAQRLNIQVFATTHSEDCVKSFAEVLNLSNNHDVGTFFRLQNRGNQIQAMRYDADRLVFAVTQDVEVR